MPTGRLFAYKIKPGGLQRIAGPVTCGSIMYRHSTKGSFAFSDMAGKLQVYTTKLKLIGELLLTTPPMFQDRTVLQFNMGVSPHEFTIHRW